MSFTLVSNSQTAVSTSLIWNLGMQHHIQLGWLLLKTSMKEVLTHVERRTRSLGYMA